MLRINKACGLKVLEKTPGHRGAAISPLSLPFPLLFPAVKSCAAHFSRPFFFWPKRRVLTSASVERHKPLALRHKRWAWRGKTVLEGRRKLKGEAIIPPCPLKGGFQSSFGKLPHYDLTRNLL